MNLETTRTTTFKVTKQHFASILAPRSMPSGDARFAVRCPASMFPECDSRSRTEDDLGPMVNCSSKHRPILVVGDGSGLERDRWTALVKEAALWNYPHNYLLLDREITVAGTVWVSSYDRFRMRATSETTYASLLAVKVTGDFTKDEGLARHIQEVKGWFDRG